MDPRTDRLLAPGDIATATALLTRLPVPFTADRAAAAAWAYPVAGFFVATLAAALASLALAFGLPPALAAGLVLAVQVIVTGAMHEDGLADSADGLWGGWTRARRLEIMRDSRIGTYGVIALVMSLGLRWQALTLVLAAGLHWPALIAVAVLSRAVMVALMHHLPHARDDGLSRQTGRPGRDTALLAMALGAVGALLLGGWAFVLIVVAGLAALAVTSIARAKIGGQTGDILGATQQVTEIALLLTIAALI